MAAPFFTMSGNPHDEPGYQKLVEDMTALCRCMPDSLRPCDGLMAGGFCDQLDMREREEDEGDEDEGEPL